MLILTKDAIVTVSGQQDVALTCPLHKTHSLGKKCLLVVLFFVFLTYLMKYGGDI